MQSINPPHPHNDPLDLLKRTAHSRDTNELQRALELLEGFLDERDNPQVWKRYGDILLRLGRQNAARAVYRNVILKFPDPHVKDIITARIPYCKPILLEEQKILYFDIPKCGSSSIKDAILIARGDGSKRELSHSFTRHLHKVIPFDALDGRYDGFEKVAVVRHPIARLRSYYKKNVVEARSLVADARGQPACCGLSAAPEYEEALEKFHDYRRVFDDFRHHTDAIVGYLGRRPSRFTRILDMRDTGVILELLAKAFGRTIDLTKSMTSGAVKVDWSKHAAAEEALVQTFYREEMEIYGKFMKSGLGAKAEAVD